MSGGGGVTVAGPIGGGTFAGPIDGEGGYDPECENPTCAEMLEEEKCGPRAGEWLMMMVLQTATRIELDRKEWPWGGLVEIYKMIGEAPIANVGKSDDVKGGVAGCPKGNKCKDTVTLCGKCVDKSVLEDILFAFAGRMRGVSDAVIDFGAEAYAVWSALTEEFKSVSGDTSDARRAWEVGRQLHDVYSKYGWMSMTQLRLCHVMSGRIARLITQKDCPICMQKMPPPKCPGCGQRHGM